MSKLGIEGQKGHFFGKVKSQKDKIMYSAHLLKFKRSKKVN